MRAAVVTSFDQPLEIKDACGTCEYCITGWETLCEAQLNTGYAIDGGHAEFAVADARYVVRVPEGIDPAEAAPLTCAGVTTYKAVKGRRRHPGRPGGHLRHRWSRAPGAAVCADLRRRDHRGRRVIEQAHASLRRGGRLILVSLPKDNAMSLPVFQTVLKGIRIIGSIVGTRADLGEVFRLHAAGRTRVLYEARNLEDINQSIEDVLASRVPARLVVLP